MNEKEIMNNEEVVIDLKRIVDAVLNKAWLVILSAVLCAAGTLAVTLLFISPKYESTAMFYVNNNAISVGDVSLSSITSSDISASKNLVNSYIVILKTRESLNEVIDYAGVNRTYKEVLEMLTAEPVENTEIFQVVVTSPDPAEAEKLANSIAYILPKRIATIIEGTSAKVVDSAVIPTKPSSPSYTINTLVGFMLGFLLSVMVLALREFFDITVRSEEDITQLIKHPILTAVPDIAAAGKGGYSYSYDRKRQTEKKNGDAKQPVLIGKGMSFAASESYKMLRTKLQFSFSDENNCRVIGVSSAMSGEGKSLTSVNLAYTLSELNKRVLLIDCDMRRPTLAEKLKISKKPGLSSYLAGQSELNGLFQYCNIAGDEDAFHVLVAGQCPPNPIELLSSAKMERFLRGMRQSFDYVILDLPPVGEVSDALAVAKQLDGMLLVVRQNYCNRLALSDTMRQFEFVGARILGVVYNCTGEGSGKYNKKYYKKYYQKYYTSYESSKK